MIQPPFLVLSYSKSSLFSKMQDFKKLKVWEKSIQLLLDTYAATAHYPVDERYNLTSQTKRAVLSISNNIAEGCGKFTKKDFANYLQTSIGSTNEVENCLIVGNKLNHLPLESFEKLTRDNIEVRKMLISLLDKIR